MRSAGDENGKGGFLALDALVWTGTLSTGGGVAFDLRLQNVSDTPPLFTSEFFNGVFTVENSAIENCVSFGSSSQFESSTLKFIGSTFPNGINLNGLGLSGCGSEVIVQSCVLLAPSSFAAGDGVRMTFVGNTADFHTNFALTSHSGPHEITFVEGHASAVSISCTEGDETVTAQCRSGSRSQITSAGSLGPSAAVVFYGPASISSGMNLFLRLGSGGSFVLQNTKVITGVSVKVATSAADLASKPLVLFNNVSCVGEFTMQAIDFSGDFIINGSSFAMSPMIEAGTQLINGAQFKIENNTFAADMFVAYFALSLGSRLVIRGNIFTTLLLSNIDTNSCNQKKPCETLIEGNAATPKTNDVFGFMVTSMGLVHEFSSLAVKRNKVRPRLGLSTGGMLVVLDCLIGTVVVSENEQLPAENGATVLATGMYIQLNSVAFAGTFVASRNNFRSSVVFELTAFTQTASALVSWNRASHCLIGASMTGVENRIAMCNIASNAFVDSFNGFTMSQAECQPQGPPACAASDVVSCEWARSRVRRG